VLRYVVAGLLVLAALVKDIPRFALFFLAGGFISWLGCRQRRKALIQADEELEQKVRNKQPPGPRVELLPVPFLNQLNTQCVDGQNPYRYPEERANKFAAYSS
jgi:hypothetical protein